MAHQQKHNTNKQVNVKNPRKKYPFFVGIYYLVGFLVATYAVYSVITKLELPYSKEIALNWFHSIYFSQHALILTQAFYGLSAMSILMRVKGLHKILRMSRGAVLVVALFCTVMYHGYLYKAPEIRSYAAITPYFDMYMMLQHGMCAMLMLMDLVIASLYNQTLHFSQSILPMLTYCAAYLGYLCVSFYVSGIWPYGFLNRMNEYQVGYFSAACVIASMLTLAVCAMISQFISRHLGANNGQDISTHMMDKASQVAGNTRAMKNYFTDCLGDKITSAKNDVVAKGQKLGDSMHQKASNLAAQGSVKAKTLLHDAEQNIEQVARNVKNKVVAKAQEFKDSVTSSAQGAKKQAEQKGTQMKNQVEGKAADVKKNIKSSSDEMVGKAAGATARVADKVSKKAHQVEDKKKK